MERDAITRRIHRYQTVCRRVDGRAEIINRSVADSPSAARCPSRAIAWLGLFGLLGAASASSAGDPAGYKVHAGDKLLVGVYDDPKLPPQEIIVTPDGKFGFPMVGQVVAGGRTVDQIRQDMETSLRKYISEPMVTLAVTDAKGNVAYVVGQVAKPGAIPMNPAINVLQALSVAGGTTPYAKLDDIIVIRNSATGQSVLPFRYGQVSAGKRLEQNVELESGDVVVVP